MRPERANAARATASTIFALSLAACAPGGGETWLKYPVLRDFGSFSGIDAEGRPYASTAAGVLKLDESSTNWRRVAMPGARATYFVAFDGTELASTYGIYVRPSLEAPWSLLEGSRALLIEAVARDAAGNIYAQTNPQFAPPGAVKALYVRLAGTVTWASIALDPSKASDVISDLAGNVYLSIGPVGGARHLHGFDGATFSLLPQPTAATFDFRGDRFLVAEAALRRLDDGMGGITTVKTPFSVDRVTAAGELESWARFDEAQPNAALSTIFGFAKDGRLYAATSDDLLLVPDGVEYGAGDIVSVGKGETSWTLAVSGQSDEADGSNAGPTRLSEYGGGFVSDGTMIFAACESGCSGSGNAFSYGIWRLQLAGQP